MSKPICLNPQCYEKDKGSCDFCDARCPYFTNIYSLILALHTMPEGKKVIEKAHNITINRILAGEEP